MGQKNKNNGDLNNCKDSPFLLLKKKELIVHWMLHSKLAPNAIWALICLIQLALFLCFVFFLIHLLYAIKDFLFCIYQDLMALGKRKAPHS